MNMKFLSLTFTILSLTAISAVATPAPQVSIRPRPDNCVGRWCQVLPEPWSGVRKNIIWPCQDDGSSYEWCVAGGRCEDGVGCL